MPKREVEDHFTLGEYDCIGTAGQPGIPNESRDLTAVPQYGYQPNGRFNRTNRPRQAADVAKTHKILENIRQKF